MKIKSKYIDNIEVATDEAFAMKPAFRIFSRSIEISGWSEFFEKKPTIVYPKGKIIIAQGEENPNIMYIIRGLVEYTNIDESGSENIQEILGPGCMLNLQPVFGHNPSIATFSALSECVLTSADKNEIISMIMKDNNLAMEMLEEMAYIIGGLNRRFTMGVERSDIRTIRVIHMIATIHRRIYEEGEPIYIKLSQNDLARIIQTTRVTISKILSEMKRKGIIETDYGGIYITNMELLSQCAKHK